MTKPLLDDPARERFLTDLDRNAVVEAGAGTGKTSAVVGRILASIDANIPLLSIAAITFTEAAAAELAARLRDAVEERLVEVEAAGEAEALTRWVQAAADLDHASISTIHGFCTACLRAFPLEANIEPSFRVQDELDSTLLMEEVFGRWFPEASRTGAVRRGVQHGLDRQTIESLLRRVVTERAKDLVLPREGESSGPPLELLAAFCRGRLRDFMSTLPQPIESGKWTPQDFPVWVAFDHAVRTCDELWLADEQAISRDLEVDLYDDTWGKIGADGELNLTYGRPRATTFAKMFGAQQADEAESLREELLRLVAAARRAIGQEVFVDLVRLAEDFAAEWAAAKERLGVLDFDDLLVTARNLVRDSEEARRGLSARHRVLFVDEFQDTDPVQAELIFRLTASPESAGQSDWRQLIPLPGRLVLVGDPKQSIYRFRNADVETYLDCCGRLISADPEAAYALTTNFRSLPAVVDWINAQFHAEGPAPMLAPPTEAGERARYQAQYVPLAAFQEERGAMGSVRWLLPQKVHLAELATAAAAQDMEARTVARYLLEEVIGKLPILDKGALESRPADWGDIAILARTKKTLAQYEACFSSLGIPFVMYGATGFYSTQEVRDVVTWLAAVARPEEPLAVVAALRGPWAGIADEELARHVAAGGDFSVTGLAGDALGSGEVEPGSKLVRAALASIAVDHGLAAGHSPAEYVESLLSSRFGAALYRTKPGAAQRSANLRKLQSLVWRLENRGLSDLRHVVRTLETFVERELGESESDIAGDLPGAVRLLTVHKSKGLEFPLVVLAGATRTPNSGGGMGEVATAVGPAGHLELRRKKGGLETDGFEDAKAHADLREAAENLRVYYVALTRARGHLLLPVFPKATWDKKSKRYEPKKLQQELARGSGAQFYPGAALVEAWLEDGSPPQGSVLLSQVEPAESVSLEPMDAGPETAPAVALDPERVTQAVEELKAWEEAHVGRLALRSRVDADSPVRRAPSSHGGSRTGLSGRERAQAQAFGTLLHRALELGLTPDDAGDLGGLAVQAGGQLLPQDLEQAAQVLRGARSMPWAKRADQAVARYHEFPLAYRQGEVQVQGRIDLLLELSSGSFEVIDFKSEAVDQATVEQHAEEHREQLELYAEGLESAGLTVQALTVVYLVLGLEVNLRAS